jgi:hypothetical protein
MKPEGSLEEFVERRDAIIRRVTDWTPVCANALHEVLKRLSSPVDDAADLHCRSGWKRRPRFEPQAAPEN